MTQTLAALKASPATAKAKAKFILATDGADFEAEDLTELGARMAEGRLSASHLIAILGAGLRGAGAAVSDEELAHMRIEGGLKGAAEIAARLLRATFGGVPE